MAVAQVYLATYCLWKQILVAGSGVLDLKSNGNFMQIEDSGILLFGTFEPDSVGGARHFLETYFPGTKLASRGNMQRKKF